MKRIKVGIFFLSTVICLMSLSQAHAECLKSIQCSPFVEQFVGYGLDDDEVAEYEASTAGYNLRLIYQDKNGHRKYFRMLFKESTSCTDCSFKTLMKIKKQDANTAKNNCRELQMQYEDIWGFCN